MIPITFNAVNRPPPSSQSFISNLSTPFVCKGRLFLRREAAGIEDCAVVRHTELTVGFKPRHFRQFLKRPKVKIAQEFFVVRYSLGRPGT